MIGGNPRRIGHQRIAAYVVTGDRHLIDMKQYAGIQMVRPAQFIHLVTADEST